MSGAGECIDSPLLRVPLEHLRRVVKDRKHIAEQLRATSSELKGLAGSKHSSAACSQTLDRIISKVQRLQRKLAAARREESEILQRCKARLERLVAHEELPKQDPVDWNRARLDHLLVDHMLRSSCLKSATALASATHCEALVETHLFNSAKAVFDGLQRRDCSAALQWCSDNSAKLRKQGSKLEFSLHVQECLELVRQQRQADALAYARKHFPPLAQDHFPELRRAMAALAFGADTTCSRYAELFDPGQWDLLVELFQKDLFQMHFLTSRSMLDLHLQAGLSVLKTAHGLTPHASKDDPFHSPAYQTLAGRLPYAKHVHSKLLCSVTKQLMNEDNVPMVMPNGTVYSEAAVRRVSSDTGMFTCPRSGVSCDVGAFQRAYIL